MARRPCIICGLPSSGTRCPRHIRTNNSTARGYGSDHQRARLRLANALPAPCWYCHTVIEVGERFVAAHIVDGDPTSERVHAHPACNERAKIR